MSKAPEMAHEICCGSDRSLKVLEKALGTEERCKRLDGEVEQEEAEKTQYLQNDRSSLTLKVDGSIALDSEKANEEAQSFG